MSSIVESVDALPVDVVIEARATCPDAARARAALDEALAGARAPGAWTVRLEVEEGGQRSRAATARIVDERGATIAERALGDRGAHGCAPLARAAGAWASLVLDDELARAKDPVDAAAPPPRQEAAPRALASAWRALEDDDERDAAPPRREGRARTVEIGVMGYLRDGLAATSGFAGASPFVAVELSPGWFVRPALAFGSSTTLVPVDATLRTTLSHLGARLDACRRIPGNYIERRGIELDVCLGGDVAHVYGRSSNEVSPMAFRASAGPSAALRGELGASTNLELRLLGGGSLARAPLHREAKPPVLFAAVEIGVSWRLP